MMLLLLLLMMMVMVCGRCGRGRGRRGRCWHRLLLLRAIRTTIHGVRVGYGRQGNRCCRVLIHFALLLEDLLFESSTAPVERSELVSAAAHPILAHRLQFHAHLQALLESTVGASLPLMLVNLTLLLVDARVELLVLYGSLEEALARLAREQTVVKAAHFVATNRTQVVEAQLDI